MSQRMQFSFAEPEIVEIGGLPQQPVDHQTPEKRAKTDGFFRFSMPESSNDVEQAPQPRCEDSRSTMPKETGQQPHVGEERAPAQNGSIAEPETVGDDDEDDGDDIFAKLASIHHRLQAKRQRDTELFTQFRAQMMKTVDNYVDLIIQTVSAESDLVSERLNMASVDFDEVLQRIAGHQEDLKAFKDFVGGVIGSSSVGAIRPPEQDKN